MKQQLQFLIMQVRKCTVNQNITFQSKTIIFYFYFKTICIIKNIRYLINNVFLLTTNYLNFSFILRTENTLFYSYLVVFHHYKEYLKDQAQQIFLSQYFLQFCWILMPVCYSHRLITAYQNVKLAQDYFYYLQNQRPKNNRKKRIIGNLSTTLLKLKFCKILNQTFSQESNFQLKFRTLFRKIRKQLERANKMQRDIMKAINQFLYSFQNLKNLRITQKTLSDGYIFMQFLSIIDYKYFDVAQISKPYIQTQIERQQRQHENSLVLLGRSRQSDQIKKANSRKDKNQLDLLTKIKNWKTLIKKVKQYFQIQHQKGIKYGDIDVVEISKKNSIEQIAKVFELVLCVIVKCKQKQEFISRIMELQQTTQQILADCIQKALQTRLCNLQSQQKQYLIQQLQSKQQQNRSLYEQIASLQTINQQLQQKIDQNQKMAETIQYQKQRILIYNKKNLMLQNQLNSSCQIDRQNQNDSSFMLFNGRQDNWEQSILQEFLTSPHQSSSKGGYSSLIESLKNRLIRQEQGHDVQVEQLQQRIAQLQEQLKSSAHFQQLLVIYQQKYEQALGYVQKVSQYEKEKNKISQQMVQKDIIIEELKNNIDQINQSLVQVQQQKIDLQLLVAKKNNEQTYKKRKQTQREVLNKTTLPQTHALNRTCPRDQTGLRHSTQLHIDQQYSKIQLSMYPLLEQQQGVDVSQLQIQIESQSLDLKRLERKERELRKQNQALKTKLEKMRKIQSQNTRLSAILVQLHIRDNQQLQILVSSLSQIYDQYDFRFNKLIGNGCTKTSLAEKQSNISTVEKYNSNQITKELVPRSNFAETNKNYARKDSRKNASLRIQDSDQILQLSIQNQKSKPNLQI